MVIKYVKIIKQDKAHRKCWGCHEVLVKAWFILQTVIRKGLIDKIPFE